MRSLRRLAGACVALAALTLGTSAQAQSNFYAGKNLEILVAVGVGGGADLYARLLAQFIGKYIPGNPTVIVENNGAAAGQTAILSLDKTLPTDGTVVLTFNPGLLLTSAVRPDEIKVNFANYAWLGSMGNQEGVCFTTVASGIKTWDDLMKKDPVIMGDSGGGAAAYAQQMVLKQVFGVKLKLVSGYTGFGDKGLAIQRGELDGDCAPWTTIPADWLRDKKINLIARFSKPIPDGMSGDVPYVRDLVADPDKKALLDMLDAPNALGRPFIMSKSVPSDRMKILRDAFDKAVHDPELLKKAADARIPIAPNTSAEADQMMQAMNSVSPAVIAQAKDILGP